MESSVGNKDKQMEWTKDLEQDFVDLKRIVSEETILYYTNPTIHFTINTDASDKHLGDVTSQKNKPIKIYIQIISKEQLNYTTTDK